MIYWATGIYIAIAGIVFVDMVMTIRPLDWTAWRSCIKGCVLWPLTLVNLFRH